MAETHTFRSSLNGFRREDVINYLEYLNARHAALVNQLKSENQALEAELATLKGKETVSPDDYATILQERDAALAELETLRQQPASAPEAPSRTLPEEELEAYRRAERAERLAAERVQQMYHQATAALAECTVQVDASSEQMDSLTSQISAQLAQLQNTMTASQAALKSAADLIRSIHPEEI